MKYPSVEPGMMSYAYAIKALCRDGALLSELGRQEDWRGPQEIQKLGPIT